MFKFKLVFSLVLVAAYGVVAHAQSNCFVSVYRDCSMFDQDTYTGCDEEPNIDPTTSSCFISGFGSSCGDKFTSYGGSFTSVESGTGGNSLNGTFTSSTDLAYCGQHYRCKCDREADTEITAYVCNQYAGSIDHFVQNIYAYGSYCYY